MTITSEGGLQRVTLKSERLGLLTIDLPEDAPTVDYIHPWNWAKLLLQIEKANQSSKRSSSIGERQAMALKVLGEVLTLLATVDWRSRHLWLVYQALKDVSEGHEHPFLKPQRKSRPKESSRLKAIKVESAAAMQVLMKNGYRKFDAAKTIARTLAESGFALTRGGKKATAKTVAAWRDRYIGRGAGDAAQSFLSALGRIECKGRLLAHLRTNDPKKKVERALSVVRRAVEEI